MSRIWQNKGFRLGENCNHHNTFLKSINYEMNETQSNQDCPYCVPDNFN
jgi:hypothetical protein